MRRDTGFWLWAAACMIVASGTLVAGSGCRPGYMKDPCKRDEYEVVEAEKYKRSHSHNWMESAHSDPRMGHPDTYRQMKEEERNSSSSSVEK